MTRREFLARGGRATAGLAGLSLAARLTPGSVQAAPEVHLTVWWWGEQEAPGLQQWVRETVHRYKAAHPGVEIATVLQATESLYPSFASAGQARQGPDIQYMWGGISTMQFVWRGYVHPISDLLSEDDLEPVFPGSLRETAFQGKVYGLPWYALPFLLVYSKPAFARAGLDPDHPPRTWDAFLSAADRLRAAGFVPLGYGVKGLSGIGNFSSLFILQELDDSIDILKAATGEIPFIDPLYSSWLHRVEEMVRKGVFNQYVSSLEYYQAQTLFLAGEAAMAVASQTKVSHFIKMLGEENVGVMLPPRFGSGRLAGRMPNTAQQLLVTSWSDHKEETADLLCYFHTPERLDRMHALSGAIPPDERFDRSRLVRSQDRTIAEWMGSESMTNYQNYWPPQMDRENLFPAVQSLFAGALSADQAAGQVDEFLNRWRDSNVDTVEKLATWASEARLRMQVRRQCVMIQWANRAGYTFLVPALAILAFVYAYPMAKVIEFSLRHRGTGVWTALDNYRRLLDDPIFWQALRNNVGLFFLIPILVVLSLVFASLLYERLRGWQVYRFFIFLPYMIPIVVTGIAFGYILQYRGLVNSVLAFAGLGGLRQDWLGDPQLAFFTVGG